MFGPATCDDGETSRKCCLALLLAMMAKLPGSVVWPCYLRWWLNFPEVLFGPATCDDGETSRKCCLALLLMMMVKLPGSVVWPCYLR